MTLEDLVLLLQQVILLLLDTLLLLVQIISSIFHLLYTTVVGEKEKSLVGEVAVVTGAGHGIGRCLSLQLSELGAKVACWDIDTAGCQETVAQLEAAGGTGLVVNCDVSDRSQVRDAAMTTRTQLGEVTLLINNAGIMPCKPFLQFTPAETERVFNVNVFSHFWTLQEFLPRMQTINKGHIVCVSSMAGITGTPNLVPYCSSKFALKGLMDALYLEHRASYPESNIKMTTIHPFVIETGLAQKPRSRFSNLIPFTSAASAARQIITAVRREYEYTFIPSHLCFMTAISKLVPRSAQLAVIDFLDCNVDPHDDD